MANYDELRAQMDRIEGVTLSLDRALRGHNGESGLIAKVENIECYCIEKVKEHDILLNGDPKDKDDRGLKGEQISIRRYIEETKASFDKAKWWFASSLGLLIIDAVWNLIRTAR